MHFRPFRWSSSEVMLDRWLLRGLNFFRMAFLFINYRWGWFILLGWVVSYWIRLKEKPLWMKIKLTATNNRTRLPRMTSEMVESVWANIGFFLSQLHSEVWIQVRRLERLHLKIFKKKLSTVFNKTCSYIYIYIYIYILSTLVKEFSVAACIIQISSKELGILVADRV